MESCIFCQIVQGKMPSYKVYEDRLFFGFLTIAPFAPGHSLLIPKKHYRWLWEIQEAGLMRATAKLSRALMEALGAGFVSYYSEGMEVKHAHLHLVPRKKGDGLFACQPAVSLSEAKNKQLAAKILKLIK